MGELHAPGGEDWRSAIRAEWERRAHAKALTKARPRQGSDPSEPSPTAAAQPRPTGDGAASAPSGVDGAAPPSGGRAAGPPATSTGAQLRADASERASRKFVFEDHAEFPLAMQAFGSEEAEAMIDVVLSGKLTLGEQVLGKWARQSRPLGE